MNNPLGALYDLLAWLYFRWASRDIDRQNPAAAEVAWKLAHYERRLGVRRGQRFIKL